ncbi:MAG: hypothetical protein AAFZ63_22580 [Bacteroidota bacterium]
MRSQYLRELELIQSKVNQVDQINTKSAYLQAIKELLDSIYDDYTKDGKISWWRIILNAGTIIARIITVRNLVHKVR